MRTAVILMILSFLVLDARGQLADTTTLWPRVPMGAGKSLATDGTRVFVAGDFATVGRPIGRLALIDRLTGDVLGTPIVDDHVNAIVHDPNGGWFVGGRFDVAHGLPASGLVRLLPSGLPDPSWMAAVQGDVRALAVVEGRLVVAGSFSAIDGMARDALATLDPLTGAVLPTTFGDFQVSAQVLSNAFAPPIAVHALAASGSVIYVAGFFESISGVPRHGYAAFDVVTGVLQPWFPTFGPTTVAFPWSVGTSSNAGVLQVSGGQTIVTNALGNQFKRVDPVSGADSGWASTVQGSLFALADDGGTLVLGGTFSAIDGSPRQCLAAMDSATGTLLPLAPSIPSGSVRSLAALGGKIHAGGFFTTVDGLPRDGFAILDAATGQVASMDLAPTGTVSALGVSSDSILLGGSIGSIAGTRRNGLAAFDGRTGALLPLQVTVTGPGGIVRRPAALALRDATLYLSGDFEAVNGQPRPGLAAVDATSGALLPFLAPPLGTNLRLVVGPSGLFVFDPTENALTLLDAVSGDPLWAVSVDQRVQDVDEGPSGVYVTGIFGSIAGQPAGHIARLDASSGTPLPFAASLEGGGWGSGLVVGADDVYVTGSFVAVSGVPRPGLVALDPATGAVRPWTPSPAPTWRRDATLVGPLLIAHGMASDAPYASDRFSGLASAWNPIAGTTESVIAGAGRVFRGGTFALVPGLFPQPGVICHDILLTSAETLSLGCSPPFGPSLTADRPVLGDRFAFTVLGPPATAGSLWRSLPVGVALAVGAGCDLWLDIPSLSLVTPFTTDGAGVWRLEVVLPPALVLDGLSLREQAVLLPPSGIQLTNGLELRFGY